MTDKEDKTVRQFVLFCRTALMYEKKNYYNERKHRAERETHIEMLSLKQSGMSRLFRMGSTWGAASYMQITASELSDKLLAELLEVDAEMTITMHVQNVDQAKAIKTIKGKVSDIDKMKVKEQKKAVRSGYDMDILPPDLVTFSQDAKNLLTDLQSRNERMFLLTFLVVNTAATRRELDNDLWNGQSLTAVPAWCTGIF